MKKYLLLHLLFCTTYCFAQKPVIDTNVFDKWPLVSDGVISNNGTYAAYTIHNYPIGASTSVIKNLDAKWQIKLPDAVSLSFTDDSKMLIYVTRKSGLCFLNLNDSITECIPNVSSYEVFEQKGIQHILYQVNEPSNELIVRNLENKKQRSYGFVKEYFLTRDGEKLILKTEKKLSDDSLVQTLDWVNLLSSKRNRIWEGTNIGNLVLDNSSTQIAFSVKKGNKNSYWYFKQGNKRPNILLDTSLVEGNTNLVLNDILYFSKDDKRLFFNIQHVESIAIDKNPVSMDVWGYRDDKIQSQQLSDRNPLQNGLSNYLAVINIIKPQIIQLQNKNEIIYFLSSNLDFAFITCRKGNEDEANWNDRSSPVFYLLSTKDGKRREIKMNIAGLYLSLSPNAKYIICIDSARRDYFSYEINTGKIRNITHALPIPLIDTAFDDHPGSKPRGIEIAGWYENDGALLIYDKYDLWELDPNGKKLPVNVTNGYGRTHNIVFRLAEDYHTRNISIRQKLILSSFNIDNKDNGFYSKSLQRKGDPQFLSKGPYLYYSPSDGLGTPIIKARDAEVYLVNRMTASASPNYYTSKDLIKFQSLSSVYPELGYNWITTELIKYNSLNNKEFQGILYKPENFDSKKKYPLIIHYYEKVSNQLNNFERPEATPGWINIPWFVSRGYLVFTPDIYYSIGEPGKSALSSVVSAAKFLSKFNWVDSSKIGIQGHSFGGYETNYIVSHTQIFAAAMSSSGFNNLISAYGSVTLGSGSPFFRSWAETGQGRIGATLWENPELYIENSPIFKIDKITTPLLMMNNKGDGVVNFSQGIEMFNAMYRLGKKVWMLQYDGEGHSLVNDRSAKDFTIRITQFFDYYLKNSLPPKWMTNGIPASMKGLETGLELDQSGRVP